MMKALQSQYRYNYQLETLSMGGFRKKGFQPGLESIKWIALVLMVLDHVNLILFDSKVPGIYQICRISMPLFCLSFGAGLARTDDASFVLKKLVIFGAVAEVAWLLSGQPFVGGNILFTLAATGIAIDAWRIKRIYAILIIIVAGAFFEGSYGAIGLVLVGFAYERSNNVLRVAFGTVLSMIFLVSFSSSYFTLLAIPIYLALRHGNVGPKFRAGRFFYYFYPAHIAALSAIHFILGNKIAQSVIHPIIKSSQVFV